MNLEKINSKSEDKCFENILSNIPNEYFKRFLKGNKKIIEEKKIKDIDIESYKIKLKDKLTDIKFFLNFQILNSKICGKLMDLEYNFTPIKADLYYLRNNKLLLSFQNQISCDEIGFINEQNIFIPEYILYYEKNNIDITKLNLFKENYFNNNSKNELIYDNKTLVGYCFSKNGLSKQIESKENNINNNLNIGEQTEQNNNLSSPKYSDIQSNDKDINNSNKNINYINNPENKEEIEKDLKKKENNQDINKENEDKIKNNLSKEINEEFEKEIKQIIEIILLMYKFEKYIEKEIQDSNKKEKYEINDFIKIKKDWIDKFKEIYLIEEIKEYLENNNLDNDNIVNIEYIYNNCVKDKKNYFEIIKKSNSNLALLSNDMINFNPDNLSHLEKNKDIFYPKVFYIINKNIYLKLMSLTWNQRMDKENCKEKYISKYIINNEKIILPYNYILKKEQNVINNYNILIFQKAENKFEFEPLVIQCFENNEKIRDEYFNDYINKIYSLGNLGDIDGNIIIKWPMKEKNISILVKLFLDIKDLRTKLEQSMAFVNLNIAKIKEYYLVDKKWMKEFLKCFDYERLIPLIKKNNEKIDYSEIKNDATINNKINEKDKLKINVKYLEKKEKKYSFKSINYYNNFEIINEDIKQSIEKLINIKIEKKAQFLIGAYKFCAFFNNKNIAYLGVIDNNKAFNLNILVEFKDNNKFNSFKEKLKEKKFEDAVPKFAWLLNNEFIPLSANRSNVGYAYKINLDNEFIALLEKIKEKKINIKPSTTTQIFEKKSAKILKIKKILVNGKNSPKQVKLKEKEDNDEKNSKGNDGNKSINEFNENGEESGQENVLEQSEKNEENNEGYNDVDNNGETNININPFYEAQIKGLISYYFFIDELKENIILSSQKKENFDSYECYLINSDWMKNFKIFFLYDELVKIIKSIIMKISPIKENKEEIIYENLAKYGYINKKIEKENSINEQDFMDLKSAKNAFDMTKDNIIYPTQFEIISPEVYNKLVEGQNEKLQLSKKEFIINSGKIILKYRNRKILPNYEILIGFIDFNNYQFISKKLIKFDNEKEFNVQFLLFKKFLTKDVLGDTNIKDKLIFLTNENHDKENEEKEVKVNEIKVNKDKSANKINEKQNEKNIEFLFNLHLFTIILKYKLKLSSQFNNSEKIKLAKCYLIKKELIDIYKKFYNFDDIIHKYENLIVEKISSKEFNEFYNSLIKKYKKEFNNKDLSEINYELKMNKNLFNVEPTRYNDPNLLCFENCIIYKEPVEIQKGYEVLYTIIDNKIILIFNHNINIGIIDDQKNIFVPEVIVKFDTKENLEYMIQLINKHGINKFIKHFDNHFDKNNLILSLNIDKHKSHNNILFDNFFNANDLSKDKKQNKLKINNNLDFNSKINSEKIKEKENENKRITSLQNVLSIMIETELIKKKMYKPLKGSKEERYFFLNSKWFKKYLELKNMKEIFDNLIDDKIIESFITNKTEENILQYNLIISEIMKNIGPKKIKQISTNNDALYYLSDKKLYELKLSYINTSEISYLIYFTDFILISSETRKLLLSEFSSYHQFEFNNFPVILGDNKIFIIIQTSSKFIIEVCHIDNENKFQPAMFFEHSEENNLIKNKKLLASYEYSEYAKYFLLFDDDYISPIFDLNNNRIGRAYRYNENLKDYSKYTSKEKKVKYMIKLYFSNYILRIQFNNNIEQKTIFIINDNYLKNIRIFSLIQNKLNQLDLSQELNEIMNSKLGEIKLDELIEGKKLSLKMKSIMSEQNDNLTSLKDNIESVIPMLLPYNGNGKEFFYFDNFRLIDISLANKLLENKIILIQNPNNNIVKFFKIEKYILIDISNNNSKDNFEQIYEVCEINEQNIIKPMYLLAYYKSNYFVPHIK